jgi:mannose-6-phosphate isomerase-like protein (cupin superfamily)
MNETPDTRFLDNAPTETAPDGSTVRPLCRISGQGSFAHFTLEPSGIARAVSHSTMHEIWYILAGTGQMWRRGHDHEDVVALRPGVCLTIPCGTAFQFRAGASGPLEIVAVTMPPWPGRGDGEVCPEQGPWQPSVWTAQRAGPDSSGPARSD